MAKTKMFRRNSITRRITRRVVLLLLAAMIVLSFGAYHLMSDIVLTQNKEYAETLLDIFSDLLYSYTFDGDKAISAENGEELVRLSNLFCDRFNVDYVYLYTFDEPLETVIYSVASFAFATEHMDPGNHMIGYTVKAEMTEGERALWNREIETYSYSMKNSYGYEITTLKAILDVTGQLYIAGIDLNYESVYFDIITATFLIVAVLAAVILAIGLALFFFTKKNISEPAQKISQTMLDYISDGNRSEIRLEEHGTYEYETIARAFNTMTDDIRQYIDNIQTLSVQQAGQEAELKIAERIQRGFLSSPEAEFGSCSLRAMMQPAKNIGGDLYDYLKLDDRRVFVVIADVSGKGISAAMFMSVTLTLLRQYAKMGLTPDEILRRTNDTLAENNSAMLFATAFVGIYDSHDGSFTYSNAGHNLPYLVGDTLQVLGGASGTVLGLYEGETYESKSVSVHAGDSVFLYTDGVSEAVNTEREFFGEERLEALLSGFKASGKDDLVTAVYEAVNDFSGDAEQHDDITMLTLRIGNETPKEAIHKELQLDFSVSEFAKIKDVLLDLPIERETKLNLCLAAEEVFVNICDYAFEGKAPEGEKILFTLDCDKDVTLRFTDGGMPFNPLTDITPPDEDVEPEIGGLGRFLYTSLCDNSNYAYANGKNVLTLTKHLTEASL